MQKITKNIIIPIILILGVSQMLLSQGYILDNNGKITNSGTIKFKSGQVKINQDTINGRVEFLQPDKGSQQAVPNMVYGQLILKNEAKKIVVDNKGGNNEVKTLIVLDSLIIDNKANFTTRWIGLNPNDIHAKASVTNNAEYTGPKDLILNNETLPQNISGKGEFSNLKIDNPTYVEVVGGGFKINEKLTLTRGEFRNSAANNFSMADSTLIIRTAGAKLIYEPTFEGVVTVKYNGTGDITTSGEIPNTDSTLKSFYIENIGEVTLSKNVTVHDSLVVRAIVKTMTDTLTLATLRNPIFDEVNSSVEVVGNFRRSVLAPGDTLYLNNPFTWILFDKLLDINNLSAITSSIYPHTFHLMPEGDLKVRRTITLMGYDDAGKEKNVDFKAKFGYGWRNGPGSSYDETNNLIPAELVLQRWASDSWQDLNSSIPTVDVAKNWAYAKADTITKFGYYAIGGPNAMNISIRGFALLEGPYIGGTGNQMTTELWERNLLSQADISQYPLNLIADTQFKLPTQFPDSVVDYVILEFRKSRNEAAQFEKLAFMKYNGRIVDLFGNERIRLTKADGMDSAGGKYFVVLRHRNHEPVITNTQIELIKENNSFVYDFTDPTFIEGGTSSLKFVEKIEDKYIYALKGGFIPYDQQSFTEMMNVTLNYTKTEFWTEAWKQFTNIGYINTDYNLSGIVTTKDFNISWNNRKN